MRSWLSCSASAFRSECFCVNSLSLQNKSVGSQIHVQPDAHGATVTPRVRSRPCWHQFVKACSARRAVYRNQQFICHTRFAPDSDRSLRSMPVTHTYTGCTQLWVVTEKTSAREIFWERALLLGREHGSAPLRFVAALPFFLFRAQDSPTSITFGRCIQRRLAKAAVHTCFAA